MNVKTVINKMLRKSISIPYCLIKRAKRDSVDFFMTEACNIAENSQYQIAYRKIPKKYDEIPMLNYQTNISYAIVMQGPIRTEENFTLTTVNYYKRTFPQARIIVSTWDDESSQETTDFSHFAALKEINMPLILFDRVCLTDQFSSVIADGAQSAQMATQHLLDNGSKRVAFIGGANHLDIVKRRKHGYLEALRENRIPIEKELVVCRKIDYEEGKIATETLLSLPQPPDAILAMNDTLAFAAMEVIKNHGLRIPNDVAIIGYTDEQHANYVEPKLSAVSHQTYKMGETACQLLIDRIKGDKTIKQVTIPTHLQIRESSIKK